MAEREQKIALLSNVNMEPIAALAKQKVITANGYGSVFEELMRPDATLYTEAVEQVFVLIDICELLVNCEEKGRKPATADASKEQLQGGATWEIMQQEMDAWFSDFQACRKDNLTYFISDVDCRNEWFWINTDGIRAQDVEGYWYERLRECTRRFSNVHIFPLKQIVHRLGRAESYMDMMWYLGRIPYGTAAREAIVKEMEHCSQMLGTPKKVLLLDLDNTLWGGVAGEGELKGAANIQLGNEKTGLIYKDLQRVIKGMKNCGVVLGIVSKNNIEDVMPIIQEHPHMILRETDFAIQKINWESKDQNIREIAAELNLGTDSFVFFDDNAAERELVKSSLPEVVVPDFPTRVEKLPETMVQIFHTYFEKWVYTTEDAEKTEQYRANAKRKELEATQTDYADFLRRLEICVERVDAVENRERLLQLLNKTNQFNLTTTRYTEAELDEILKDKEHYNVYLFQVSDRFGNNGITAAVIVHMGERAEVESFVMSCRIMGRKIEHMILDYVVTDVQHCGYNELWGRYVFTKKSKPVEHFYEDAKFQLQGNLEQEKVYCIALAGKKPGEWYGTWLISEATADADKRFQNRMMAYVNLLADRKAFSCQKGLVENEEKGTD